MFDIQRERLEGLVAQHEQPESLCVDATLAIRECEGGQVVGLCEKVVPKSVERQGAYGGGKGGTGECVLGVLRVPGIPPKGSELGKSQSKELTAAQRELLSLSHRAP